MQPPQSCTPLNFTHTVTERFLRYVVIDTQSDGASPTCPSTDKQKDLGALLAAELRDIGLSDAHMDAHGYVYATIPATTDKRVPVICFCSHMDTSPDCSGTDVKPQIVRNYRGGDIVLPGDPDPDHPRRGAPGPRRPDRQRHRHLRRHHAARRRQQGRRRRNHGCGAVPDRQSADQARHHQDPVHARRRDRPRRRQGRPEETRRRLRLHHGRRNRRRRRGRNLFGRWRPHHHRGRLDPSRLCQGQDGARHQDRRGDRRTAAEGHLLAGNHRGQGGLSASDRHLRARWRARRWTSSCAISPTQD